MMMKLNIQMFAVPFRKVSKTRKRMRRTHYKIEANGTVKCPKCGGEDITQYTRVIGYLRPIKAFGFDRLIEAGKRVYSNKI